MKYRDFGFATGNQLVLLSIGEPISAGSARTLSITMRIAPSQFLSKGSGPTIHLASDARPSDFLARSTFLAAIQTRIRGDRSEDRSAASQAEVSSHWQIS